MYSTVWRDDIAKNSVVENLVHQHYRVGIDGQNQNKKLDHSFMMYFKQASSTIMLI